VLYGRVSRKVRRKGRRLQPATRDVPFTGKDDPRNGRGQSLGAPNAGRPRNTVRALARERSQELLADLVAIAKNPEEDRIWAIEVIGRWVGVEKLELGLGDDDDTGPAAFGFVLMPPMDRGLAWMRRQPKAEPSRQAGGLLW